MNMPNLQNSTLGWTLRTFVVALLLGLMACSSDSGKTGSVNPPPEDDDDGEFGVVYRGPSPSSSDVNNFKVHLWDNIAMETRCGGCHVQANQSPQFARSDDINLAYTAANGVVNLLDPISSRLVEKVAGGHGCWTTNNEFCAEKLTEWVTAWASDSGVELTETALRVPEMMDVSASLSFPTTTTSFGETVYPLLTQYCADCHRADAPQPPVQPYFSSTDIAVAYAAAQTKMLFNVTENAGVVTIDASRSRFVVRLRDEAHNCWGDSCVTAANSMESALEAFAATMEMRELDASLMTSKAMRVGDGTAISQGGRVETNAIAIYPFKAGQGDIVNDYADAFPPALDLQLVGDVEWVSNWGVRINDGRVQGPTASSSKLARYIKQTGEYSVEAWVVPANVTQEGPARIVTYSGSDDERNFTLGQTLYNYNFANRSSTTSENGTPLLSTPNADEVLQATLQHVVISYNALEGRKTYVNGELVAAEMADGGNINDWDDTFALVLGNETSGQYPWRGTIRFLAIHNRVLTPEQVAINFDVGVGQKILVAFSVGHLLEGMADAYIVFQVEQFDDYSYLFSEPYFFSFTQTPPTDITIQGLRIGVNGREAAVGQVFAKLDTVIGLDNFDPEGVPLSRLGAVIQLEKGAEQDQFFLSFERIGNQSNPREEEVVPPPAEPEDAAEPQARIGVRLFAEINATLSALTRVPVTDPGVAETYRAVEQQMPADESAKGFLVAHQMGITQLSVKYCNTLANNNALRQSYFPGFVNNTFDAAGRNAIINPLLEALLAHESSAAGRQLTDQPLVADSRTRLGELIDTMTSNCNNNVCSDTVSRNTITAVCAAALGSAVMLVQ
jgi:Concanavalin A-like lectin/glucanases superfamily